jgi:hypothetical protein
VTEAEQENAENAAEIASEEVAAEEKPAEDKSGEQTPAAE